MGKKEECFQFDLPEGFAFAPLEVEACEVEPWASKSIWHGEETGRWWYRFNAGELKYKPKPVDCSK